MEPTHRLPPPAVKCEHEVGSLSVVRTSCPHTTAADVQVDLRISCTKLQGRDGFAGKSDPFCVVSEKDLAGVWRELGRTEVVNNNHGVLLRDSSAIASLVHLQRRAGGLLLHSTTVTACMHLHERMRSVAHIALQTMRTTASRS